MGKNKKCKWKKKKAQIKKVKEGEKMNEGISNLTEKKVDVLMSEMAAIRNEINTTKETIHSILNFFFILISAEISLFIAVSTKVIDPLDKLVRLIILIIPFLFLFLSFYHSECVMRIHKYINYIDIKIREKIEELLGEPLLNDHSKTPTKSFIGVFKHSPWEAKMGYLSKLGIKLISMALPLVFYIKIVHHNWEIVSAWEWVLFILDVLITLLQFFMQHD